MNPETKGDEMSSIITQAVALILLAEASGDADIGRAGERGRYQLTAIYVRHVNARCGTHFRHEDAHDPVMAERITQMGTRLNIEQYKRKHHALPTVEQVVRMHQAGPTRWNSPTSGAYYKRALARQPQQSGKGAS